MSGQLAHDYQLSIGDPDSWVRIGGKLSRLPLTSLDRAYFSSLCGEYESKRQQLNHMKKLKGLEEEVVQQRSA